MELPNRSTLRRQLAQFDDLRTKIVGGVLAVMFGSPDKIRDRDWMAEQFTQVTLLTGHFDGDEHAHEGAERATRWIQDNIHPILNACFALFVHVAEDMREAHGQDSFSASDAMVQALSYFDDDERR